MRKVLASIVVGLMSVGLLSGCSGAEKADFAATSYKTYELVALYDDVYSEFGEWYNTKWGTYPTGYRVSYIADSPMSVIIPVDSVSIEIRPDSAKEEKPVIRVADCEQENVECDTNKPIKLIMTKDQLHTFTHTLDVSLGDKVQPGDQRRFTMK